MDAGGQGPAGNDSVDVVGQRTVGIAHGQEVPSRRGCLLLGGKLAADLLLVEPSYGAVGVVHDGHVVDAEKRGGQGQRPQHVGRDPTAGIAEDLGVSGSQPERREGLDPGVDTGDEGEALGCLPLQPGQGKVLGVGAIALKEIVEHGHHIGRWRSRTGNAVACSKKKCYSASVPQVADRVGAVKAVGVAAEPVGSAVEPSDRSGDDDPLRQALLDAAARVCARQGYDGTRILDIVREAGLSTGAVYGRFSSKDDLLRQAVITRSVPRLHPPATDGTRVADLVRRGAELVDGELSDRQALLLETYAAARREPQVRAAVVDADEAWRRAAAPLVDAARADGTVADDVDPAAVLFLVRTLRLGLLLQQGSHVPAPDPGSWRQLIARVVASFGAETPSVAGGLEGRGCGGMVAGGGDRGADTARSGRAADCDGHDDYGDHVDYGGHDDQAGITEEPGQGGVP